MSSVAPRPRVAATVSIKLRSLWARICKLLPVAVLVLAPSVVFASAVAPPPNAASVTATGGSVAQKLSDALSCAGVCLNSAAFPVVGDGTTDDTTALQAMANALPASGGTIIVEKGASGIYKLTTRLSLKSNTTLVCRAGVFFQIGPSFTAGPVITNVNYGASTITDHDITIIGCGVRDTQFSGSGNYHGFGFQFVQRLHVYNPVCDTLGDCVAVISSSQTDIHDGYATTISNACWDHWGGSTDIAVYGGYCEATNATGFFATGSKNGATGAMVTQRGFVIGGTYVMTNTTGSALPAIALNGTGSFSGSGAQFITVDGVNVIYTTSQTGQYCVYLTGNTQFNTIRDVNCRGGRFVMVSETAGTPSNNSIVGGHYDNPYASGLGVVSVSNGSNNTFSGITVTLGTGAAASSFNDNGSNYYFNNTPITSASGVATYTGVLYGVQTNPISGSITLTGSTLIAKTLPTSCSGKSTGTLWNNSAVVNVCP